MIAAAMMTKRRAAAARRPPRPLPEAGVRGAVRAAHPPRGRDRRGLAGDRRPAAGRRRRDLHPGVDLDAFTPSPLPAGPAARARARRARRLEAPGPRARDRRADARAAASRSPASRCPARPFDADARAHNVTFAGRVDDIRDALADAHVLLHCADAEPFGLALVEALAAGRPVVAPAAGGPLEIVAGRRGRLYPPGDADAAVEALAPSSPTRGARSRAAPRRGASTSATPSAASRPRSTPRSSPAPPPAERHHGRRVSFAVVIVLHRSRDGARHAARDAAARAGADRRRRRPRRRRRALAREHGATVLERRDNPGFGAACNARRSPTSPSASRSCSTRTPRTVGDASPRSPQRAATPRPARAPAAQRRRQRPAQRAPAPGHAGRVHARAAPPCSPSAPSRSAPRAAHRRLGDRRLPRRAHGAAARASTSASTCGRRTWTSACGPARGIRDDLPPRPAVRHTGRHSVERRSRSSSSRATAAT